LPRYAVEMDSNQLRASFTGYFAARGHEVVPSASLIPHDPTVLFTIAGMVPFKPYFLGEEKAPWSKATTVQKCFRTVDIDIVGRTARHCTFFEMLGNFSFGDYFKEGAIPLAWGFITEVLGIDPAKLWVTVHTSDDEAAQIWHDAVGVPMDRIQKMGEDNFWQMGETGPCGPCSEIYYDKGPEYGADGGPAHGGATRFVEIWNLVFMQYNRQSDGEMAPLPRRNIDTGAGLERILPILLGTDSVYATDSLAPMIERAQSLTGVTYGKDDASDVRLRILADHGRAMTMLVGDGVIPSNEARGYVLRRVIRRAVLAARRLGANDPVAVALSETAASVMGDAYPNLRSSFDVIAGVVEREEAGFDRTLRAGLALLDTEMSEVKSKGGAVISGDVAFRLHDTHGFPVELTEELSAEAQMSVDKGEFEALMLAQRERARAAARVPVAADESAYRSLIDANGPTEFVGRSRAHYVSTARVIGVLSGEEPGMAEIFLDRSPFYAEGGGQVGDQGTIVTESGRAEVYDTVVAVPGLFAHRARVSGEIVVGQEAMASIDADRRLSTMRNHTGTHVLHAALRTVLGDQVRQQGSYVGPDRLRFDYAHHAAPAKEELEAVVTMANEDILSDAPVETVEVSKKEADQAGAVAFFGDKYGDVVRMVRAGEHSLELCGGTHVDALGNIGMLTVIGESSIGANTRRIEAVTGTVTLHRELEREQLLAHVATTLKSEPDTILVALERLVERQRATEKELARLRASAISDEAAKLAASASGGIVVARRDGFSPDELRNLAQNIRQHRDIYAVAVVGSPDGERVSVAVATGGSPNATEVVRAVAGIVGGGGGGSAELALAGGRELAKIDAALDEARRVLAQ